MNAAMIELHTYQARDAWAHHLAIALGRAGMQGGEYPVAAHKDVVEAARLLAGWMLVVVGPNFYHSTHLSHGSECRSFFIRTEEGKEKCLNADSAFELYVRRSSGFRVDIEMPAYGERVFVNELHEKYDGDVATQHTPYHDGCTARITAQAGTWVEVDGDANPETFRVAGDDTQFRVRHQIRVGESVVV